MLSEETASREGALTKQPTPTELAIIAAPLLASRNSFNAESDMRWAVLEAHLLWTEAREFIEGLKPKQP
jgi:hypothetical protein